MKAVRWIDLIGEGGQIYGYSLQSVKQREQLLKRGWAISDDAPIAVHVGAAALFPFLPEDAFNILNTHVEAASLSPEAVDHMARFDLIIVASTWAAAVIREHLPGKPVHVVPLGIDPREIQSMRRRFVEGKRPFRFLWVGSPTARKGWELLIRSTPPPGVWYLHGWDKYPGQVELYVKTSKMHDQGVLEIVPGHNVILDTRKLSREHLVALYYTADAFLFPSFGEGFGLPLLEAMASGCPCIWTHYSGVTDFARLALASEAGYATPYEMIKIGSAAGYGFGPECEAPQARREFLSAQMITLLRDHRRVALRAKRNGDTITATWTWDRTGQALSQVLSQVHRQLEERRCLRPPS